jgi:hypothetical protein
MRRRRGGLDPERLELHVLVIELVGHLAAASK